MNFEEHSRNGWQRTDAPTSYPGDQGMQIGCLQRIAKALERLTVLLDPKKLDQENKNAEAQAEWEREFKEWDAGPGKLYDQLAARIEQMVAPAKCGNAWKIRQHLGNMFGLSSWVGEGDDARRVTIEELREVERKIDAYDIRDDDLSWLAPPGKFKYADKFRAYVESLKAGSNN